MSTDTEPPKGMSVDRARDLLTMSVAEREDASVTDEDVQSALHVVATRGSEADKRLGDIVLPAMEFEYEVFQGANNHPLDLAGAEIESLSFARASLRLPLILDGATIGDLDFDYATCEHEISLEDATVGSVSAYEATFAGNVECPGTTIEGSVDVREAEFRDDVSFDGATFAGEVVFDAAELYGVSNRLDDNTSFDRARFEGLASFRQTSFGFTEFRDATFADEAVFTEATVDGDADFTDATFEGSANFAEYQVDEDTSFAGAVFETTADFRGTTFHGGARTIEDDLTFADATFSGEAAFRDALFRRANFDGATFADDAVFERVAFADDADFRGAVFEALADFDEARFETDGDFTDASFESGCNFRGAEFHGGDNHLDVAATFRNVDFGDETDFDNALFATAVFEDVVFTDVADFREASFEEAFTFFAEQRTNEAYVDFEGASLVDGEIRQPEGGWVRYDLTRASLGSVDLVASTVSDRRQLLDYFRFCETEFDEFDGHDFDFSEHTDYLDRNDWVLHEFDASQGYQPTVELTPETTERTYLKAKIAASSAGNQQAAGEFRIKRQEFARRKYWGIVGDAGEDTGTRLRNAARAVENRFLGITCGHGLRLTRILVVFGLFPLLPALLYTYGGMLPGFPPEFFLTTGPGEQRLVTSIGDVLSSGGIGALFANLSFAYITFLTVGYGNAAPTGGGANVVAAGSVYVGVILGGLLLYALIKRSEV